MKRRDFIFPLYFVLLSIILEIITFLSLKLPIFKLNVPIMLMYTLLFGFFILLIPKNTPKAVVVGILTTLNIVLVFANYTIYGLYGDIFSFQLLKLAGDAFLIMDRSFFAVWFMVLDVIMIVANGFMITIINNKLNTLDKQEKRYHKKAVDVFKNAICLTLCSVMILLNINVFASFLITKNPIVDAQSGVEIPVWQDNEGILYNNSIFKLDALNKFGTYAYLWKDFQYTFESENEFIESALKFADANVLNEKTSKNGVSAGNNVVVIMMESCQPYVFDEYLTPNLYKLLNGQGVGNDVNYAGNYSANYLSKSKTNFSEIGAMTGTSPYYSSLASGYDENNGFVKGAFDYALPSIFQQQGYTTSYFINHDIEYYGREFFYGDYVGFDKLYDSYQVDEFSEYFDVWGEWVPDSMYFEHYLDTMFPKDEQFFSWITTMCGHGPYGATMTENSAKKFMVEDFLPYIEIIDDYEDFKNPLAGMDAEDSYKWYTASVMDLDKGIGLMIDDLIAKDLLDKTTIVMFGDHEAYYYGLSQLAHGISVDDAKDPLQYEVPMFVIDPSISANEIENNRVTNFCSFFDIYGTILDLFGIDYNTNITYSKSIFSSEIDPYKLFISPTTGLLNDKIYSQDGNDFIVYYGEELTAEDIDKYHISVNYTIYKALIMNYLFTENLYLKMNYYK